MNIQLNGLLVLTYLCLLLILESPCLGAPANDPVKTGVLRWGGPGYDSARSKGSTRFAAQVASMDGDVSDKPTVEIVVDTEETYQDLGKLILVSYDNSVSATSIRRWKSQRHYTAPWTCVFLVEDIKRLPDEGQLIAKDSSGKTVLTEEMNIGRLKALIADMRIDKTKMPSNRTGAGAGK